MRRCVRRCLVRLLVPGPLAQLVEQGTLNPKVVGSIPTRPIPGLPASSAHSPQPGRKRLGWARCVGFVVCSSVPAMSGNAHLVGTPVLHRRTPSRRLDGEAFSGDLRASPRRSCLTLRQGRDERQISQVQRQLVADVLAVMSDHPSDVLWRAWEDGELERIRSDGLQAALNPADWSAVATAKGTDGHYVYPMLPTSAATPSLFGVGIIASPNVPCGDSGRRQLPPGRAGLRAGDARCRMGHDQRRVRQEPRLGSL